MRNALTGSLVFLISCCFANEARLFAAPNDDWENQVIEGLASADLAGTLTMILESVVEEGAETTQMKLADCLKSCKARFGVEHLKTKSVQLGINHAYQLAALSDDALTRLVMASRQSSEGFALVSKGQIEAAFGRLKASLKIQREILGDESLSVALLHGNIGSVCAMLVDIKGAKHHFVEADRCWKKLAFEIHPFSSVLIANKATAYGMLGLDSYRMESCIRARDIALATSGKQSLNYLYPQVELATLFFEFARFDEGLDLVDSLDSIIAKKAVGHVALNLNFLRLKVIAHSRRRNQVEKERAIDEWIAYATDNLSVDFPSSLKSLCAACYYLLEQKRKDKARSVLKTIDFEVSRRNSDSVNFSKILADFGLLHFHIGDTNKALPSLRRSVKSIQDFMESEPFRLLNERAQRNFKIGGAWIVNCYFQVALSVGTDAEEISDITLFWKGIATLNKALNKAPGNKSKITTKRLIDELMPGTVFVNIVEYSKSKPTKMGIKFLFESVLIAIILEPGKKVRICELGPSEKIEDLVNRWRAGVSSPQATSQQQFESAQAAATLKTMVWDPLELDLPRETLICISPDSSLGAFSFDALPSDKAGRLLMEDYRFLTIPIPGLSNVQPEQHDENFKNRVVLFGNIDYGKWANDGSDKENSNDKERTIFEGGRAGLGALVHSKREIDSVRQLFSKESVFIREREKATEESFRNLVSNSSHLLISSHAICEWRSSGKPVYSLTTTPSQMILNNLDLKSGIAFANANKALEQHEEEFLEPTDSRDGLLYSSEIEKLDLSGLKVAFLSACSTGNGAPSGGEGLIGLSRSFQIAGARSTVATLWNVNDEATSKITAKFFALLIREELSPVDAIRQAKLWAIRNRREVKKIDSPRYALPAEKRSDRLSAYYWAPFVVSGSLPLKK